MPVNDRRLTEGKHGFDSAARAKSDVDDRVAVTVARAAPASRRQSGVNYYVQSAAAADTRQVGGRSASHGARQTAGDARSRAAQAGAAAVRSHPDRHRYVLRPGRDRAQLVHAADRSCC